MIRRPGAAWVALAAALPIDVLSGSLSACGVAHGRPLGVAADKTGAPRVADVIGHEVPRMEAQR